MLSRSSLLAALVAAIVFAHAAFAAAPRAHTLANWNLSEQRLVVRAGVMHNLAGHRFDGQLPLSVTAMRRGLAAIASHATPASTAVAVGRLRPLTVVRFDALLVDQLGLADVAAKVQRVAARAGLAPPSYFGTEVVARYVGLRDSHPAVDDALDLYPSDSITRAEAAHSFAVVLRDGGWAVSGTRADLSRFALPHYDTAQRQVLSLAVSKIGMPYVWGGTTDNAADGLPHGGYDCSGFVWRVYKVSGFSWGTRIGGRTAAQQAAEIPRSQRIRRRAVRAGDLLFFGTARFRSAATERSVIHEGIALGHGWVIHSSDQGVYVLPLSHGWLHDSFAWARRLL